MVTKTPRTVRFLILVLAIAAVLVAGEPTSTATAQGWLGFTPTTTSSSIAGATNTSWSGAATHDIDGPNIDLWVNNHTLMSEALVDVAVSAQIDTAVEAGGVALIDTHGNAFSDIDGDGDEDLFEVMGRTNDNRLFRNDNGSLTTIPTGNLTDNGGRGRQPLFFDFDDDGDMDVLITNLDRVPIDGVAAPSELYLNNGSGTAWTKVNDPNQIIYNGNLRIAQLTSTGPATEQIVITHNSTRVAYDSIATNVTTLQEPGNPATSRTNLSHVREVILGDFDGDLHPEIVVARGNESVSAGAWPLQIFDLVQGGSPVATPSLPIDPLIDNCRSAAAADFDNDGDLDILGGCSQKQEGQNRNILLLNDGVGNFTIAATSVLPSTAAETAAGLLVADINNDGWVDAWVGNGYDTESAVDHILYNQGGTSNHWLEVDLDGSNPDAAGAQVFVGSTQWQVRETGHRNHRAQDSRTLHFGLGGDSLIAPIEIHWPDGTYESCTISGIDRRLTIAQGGPGCVVRTEAAHLATLAQAPAAVAAVPVAPERPNPIAGIDPGDSPLGVSSPVWAVAEANGRYYVGGEFTEIAGESQPFLAAIEVSTGRLDQLWRPQIDGIVNSIAVTPDGSAVYVGGRFLTIDGTIRHRVAKLDAVTGAVDPSFNPNASAAVEALVTDGTSVWAGGVFTNIGGASIGHFARLDATSGNLTPGWTTGTNGNVLDLDLDGNRVYVAGNFTALGPSTVSNLGSVNASTGVVDAWAPAAPHKIFDIDTHPNGSLIYAGAAGTASDGGNALHAFDTSTAAEAWRRIGGGDVQAVAATADAVFAGSHGNFIFMNNDGPFLESDDNANAVRRNKLSAFDPITGQLDAWDPDADSIWGVWALEVGPSGLLVGGDFLSVGGIFQSHIAVFGDVGVGNVAPEPRFSWSCSAGECDFDASSTSDPDGLITSYTWDFGDGQTAGGVTPTVTLADDAAHAVTLTVTDTGGATATFADPVVTGGAGVGIEIVGSTTVNASSNPLTGIIPANATVNDVAIAFVSVNDTSLTPTAPPGWTDIGDHIAGSLRTRAWVKVLGPADAGTSESFMLGQPTKSDLTITVFRGVDVANPIAAESSTIETLRRAGHRAPALAFGGDAAVLRYWADRTALTTSLQAPGTHATLTSSVGVGGGHITSTTALQIANGSSPVATAVADEATPSAIGWSIALRPAAQVVLNPIDGSVARVIHIGIDGLRPDAINATDTPNIHRLVTEGSSTMNARTDAAFTKTLPNFVSQLTSRGVLGPDGHGVDIDDDAGTTVHAEAGQYIASVFDVVHDNSRRTAAFVSKSDLDMIDRSWNVIHGAVDTTGVDDGRDKIDAFVRTDAAGAPVEAVLDLIDDPADFTFLHLRDPDDAGHLHGWGTPQYQDAVRDVDARVGLILQAISTEPTLAGTTAVLVTSDHGGPTGQVFHGDVTNSENYTVPFIVWGPSIDSGADLYALNAGIRTDPGTAQVANGGGLTSEPIRGHDAANLSLALLGLDPIPGSTYNAPQTLVPGIPRCSGQAVTVFVANGDLPTQGPDVILGTQGNDVINALGGDDTICGLGGDDTINGGNGSDVVYGGSGNDVIGGQGGPDTIYAGSGNDAVNGGVGNDEIWGGAGDDDLRGQGNDDTLWGEGGVDQFFGGSGNDTIDTGPGGNLGTAQVVRGQGNDDTITGSSGADELDGGPGLDEIHGGGGTDTITGGIGFDRLWGDAGNDTLIGGASRDVLRGGSNDDELVGGLGDDDLFGEDGADSLDGSGGTDLCNGGAGSLDVVVGGCETTVEIP